MIPQLYIEQWKAVAPWGLLALIEQDLVISRALVDLYNNETIAGNLAFRGGTALNKLFLKPAARYSEDLDFVQIKPGPIGETIDAIRSVLDFWLGQPKRKLTNRSVKLVYRYQSIDNTPSKLKVEINSSEHFHVEGFKHYPYQVDSEWFSGKAMITSYGIDELMGTKLRALYQRRKGRDLFDLWYVAKHNLIDSKKVVSIFEQYAHYNNEPISRALFEKNLYEKRKNEAFRTDTSFLLVPGMKWDFVVAMHEVQNQFIKKLSGDPWKGEGEPCSNSGEAMGRQ